MRTLINSGRNLSLRQGLHANIDLGLYHLHLAPSVFIDQLGIEAASSRERKEQNHGRYQLGGAV